MAERTGIMVLLRRHLAALMALGVGAVVATSIVATSGDFDTLEVGTAETNDITLATGAISTQGVAGLTIAPLGPLTLSTGTAATTIDADNTITTQGVSVVQTFKGGGGGTSTVDASGITLAAASAGDDILISAGDAITLAATTGSATMFTNLGGTVATDSAGAVVSASSAGDDVILSANDDLTATASDVVVTATGGGVLTLSSSGGSLAADSAGNDLDITAADNLFCTANDFQVTSVATAYMGVTGGGQFNLTASGVAMDAVGATDDVTITSGDLVSIATSVGGQFQTSTGGASVLAISTGDDITIDADDAVIIDGTSFTSSVVSGGTKYRVGNILEFDYPNTGAGGTTEAAVASIVLDAGALSDTGRGIKFEGHGHAVANANAKTIRIRFGASGISGSTGTTVPSPCVIDSADGDFYFHGWLYRTGVDTQRMFLQCLSTFGVVSYSTSATAAVDDGAATQLNLTVETPTNAADVTIYGVRWEAL